MALEHGRPPNVVDAIPQSVIVSPRYGLRIATYAPRRFLPLDAIRNESRASTSPAMRRSTADEPPVTWREVLAIVLVVLLFAMCFIAIPYAVGEWL